MWTGIVTGAALHCWGGWLVVVVVVPPLHASMVVLGVA